MKPRALLTIAGSILCIVSIVFFSGIVRRHWDSISSIEWDQSILRGNATALLLYIATYPVMALAWGLALRALGTSIPFPRRLRIVLLSQFGKYLPGNVGQHVGRVALARDAGIAMPKAISSVLVDTLAVMVAAALCSLPVLDIAWVSLRRSSTAILHTVALLGCLLVLAAALAFAVRWFRRFALEQIGLLRVIYVEKRYHFLLGAALGYCVNFLLGALALLAIAHGLAPGGTSFAIIRVTGVYAAAWLLGFLVPGAPAGLGIREVVLFLGLTPILGAPSATTSSALLRVVTTLGDGILFLFAVLWSWLLRHSRHARV